MRELIVEDDSAWKSIKSAVRSASSAVVLARDEERVVSTLHRLQVTSRSTLGALAYNCGGLLIDHGWLRILGGGTDQLVDLATANMLAEPTQSATPPGHLVVAQDILGGAFAINGGDLPAEPGEVAFWGPDTLDWAGVGVGHSDFVHWAIAGGTTDFYRDLRWDGWQDVAASLGLNEGLSLWPPPSTVEGQDIATTSKKAVPMAELVAFHQDLSRAIDGREGPIAFRVGD